MKSRRGQYFEIDAMIAMAILVLGLIYVQNLRSELPIISQGEIYSQEIVKLLRVLEMGDLEASTLAYFESTNLSIYTDRNFSVSKQVAIYMYKGNQTLAVNLTRSVLDPLVPDDLGYGVFIVNSSNSTEIYSRAPPRPDQNIYVGRTLVSGLQQDKVIIGDPTVDIASLTEVTLLNPALIEVHVWQ